jgi:hypothetical protein
VPCKLIYPNHVSERSTVTLRAGYPNSSGGVTFFGEKIDIVIEVSDASDLSSTLNDNVLQSSNPEEPEITKV